MAAISRRRVEGEGPPRLAAPPGLRALPGSRLHKRSYSGTSRGRRRNEAAHNVLWCGGPCSSSVSRRGARDPMGSVPRWSVPGGEGGRGVLWGSIEEGNLPSRSPTSSFPLLAFSQLYILLLLLYLLPHLAPPSLSPSRSFPYLPFPPACLSFLSRPTFTKLLEPCQDINVYYSDSAFISIVYKTG